MATVHVLENLAGGQNYSAVTHVATPTGNNAVGTPWKTCWLATFLPGTPSSRLPSTGNANTQPGQISATEANQIAAGDLMEFSFIFTDDPLLTTAQRNAMIDAAALASRTAQLADLQQRFTYYGYTRA